ncbi:hypothetical protein L7F22_043347 [Adiantum nelumboides]|nr:hypothetical protein [Adiantum nelumboides]
MKQKTARPRRKAGTSKPPNPVSGRPRRNSKPPTLVSNLGSAPPSPAASGTPLTDTNARTGNHMSPDVQTSSGRKRGRPARFQQEQGAPPVALEGTGLSPLPPDPMEANAEEFDEHDWPPLRSQQPQESEKNAWVGWRPEKFTPPADNLQENVIAWVKEDGQPLVYACSWPVYVVHRFHRPRAKRPKGATVTSTRVPRDPVVRQVQAEETIHEHQAQAQATFNEQPVEEMNEQQAQSDGQEQDREMLEALVVDDDAQQQGMAYDNRLADQACLSEPQVEYVTPQAPAGETNDQQKEAILDYEIETWESLKDAELWASSMVATPCSEVIAQDLYSSDHDGGVLQQSSSVAPETSVGGIRLPGQFDFPDTQGGSWDSRLKRGTLCMFCSRQWSRSLGPGGGQGRALSPGQRTSTKLDSAHDRRAASVAARSRSVCLSAQDEATRVFGPVSITEQQAHEGSLSLSLSLSTTGLHKDDQTTAEGSADKGTQGADGGQGRWKRHYVFQKLG